MSNELIPVEKDDPHAESKAIVARLLHTGAKLDIQLPDTLAEQQQWALAQYDNHLKSGVLFGYALVVIKQQLQHGEFLTWLDSNNVKKSNAYNYMKIAKFLSKIPESGNLTYQPDSKSAESALLENQSLDIDAHAEAEIDAVLAKIINLPTSKQLELAKAPAEKVIEWMQLGVFDEIEKMPPSTIRQVIKQQKELEKLQTIAENAYSSEKALREHIADLQTLPRPHLQMDVMRKQILEDCEVVSAAMQRMRSTFESAKHFTHEFEEDARQLIALPAIHTLDGILGSCYHIAKNYRERWDVTTELPISSPRFESLTDAELFRITETVKAQQATTRRYEAMLAKAAEEQGKAKRRK